MGRKKAKEEAAWKNNFLNRFLEHSEQLIKKQEYEDFYLKRPKNLRTRPEGEQAKDPSPKKSPKKSQ